MHSSAGSVALQDLEVQGKTEKPQVLLEFGYDAYRSYSGSTEATIVVVSQNHVENEAIEFEWATLGSC